MRAQRATPHLVSVQPGRSRMTPAERGKPIATYRRPVLEEVTQ